MELVLGWLLGLVASLHIEIGTAYTFSAAEGAPSNPVAYAACLKRELRDDKDFVVAHRSLPCRSKVHIWNLDNGRIQTAIIGDRGPYGKTKHGRYRGIVDLAPLVNKALRAKGQATVILIARKP